MVTREQAFEIVLEARTDAPELGCHEFPGGFVVWAELPHDLDPGTPPGGGRSPCYVVDRGTGELSVWPPSPAILIAKRYQETHPWA